MTLNIKFISISELYMLIIADLTPYSINLSLKFYFKPCSLRIEQK